MRSERWLKPFVRLVTVLCLLVVAGGALLYYELSSWEKMHSDLTWHLAAAPSTGSATPTPAPTPALNEDSPLGAPVAQATPFRLRAAPLDAATAYLVDRFVANNGRIDVCGQLSNQPTPARRHPALGQPSSDPAIESAFIPVAHFLGMPSVQRVTLALANAHQNGDASEIAAPAFKQAVDAAAAELATRQVELASASQAAYNLFALSRAVELIPQMGTDSAVQDFCSRQQDLALGSSTVSKDQASDDKSQLFRILSTAGLGPDDVEYDPRTGAQIEAIVSQQGVHFGAAWLSVIDGGGFEIANPLAAPETTSGATSGAATE